MSSAAYESLYQKIYNDLVEHIQFGHLQPGDKMPTEKELMEQYQVSRITASRAMSELAKNGYITRARKIGSIVSGSVAPVVSEPARIQVIPLVIPMDATDTGDLISGLQQKANDFGYVIPLYNTNRDLNTERKVLSEQLNKDIGGIICYPLETYRNVDLYVQFMARQIPVLFLDRPIGGIDFPVVSSDNERAAYDLASLLIRKGHRRLAFASFSSSSYTTNQRLRGFLKAQLDNGIQPNPDQIFHLKTYTHESLMMKANNSDDEQAIRAMLTRLSEMPSKPTVLMCEHDLLASHVEKQARVLGISIPDDLSVTGFDNLFYCEHVEVPLTSVAQNFRMIGQKAAEQMAAIKSGRAVEKNLAIPCTIVERKSVAVVGGA